jgi:hypothetical protein
VGLESNAAASAAAISKTWRRLDEDHRLVMRDRRGRLSKVVALREDGSGRPYTYPTGNKRDERYFKIPFEFWTADDRWYRTLSFRAKAMLLVSLSLPSGFVLPTNRVPDWYGISSDSADRGLRELDHAGILERRLSIKKAPQAPLGFTQEFHHTLRSPFTQRRPTRTVTRLRGVS